MHLYYIKKEWIKKQKTHCKKADYAYLFMHARTSHSSDE